MTKILFRKYKTGAFSGDVIAFFVDDYRRGEIVCYEHYGQHGTAALEFMTDCTEDASPEEFAELKAELETVVGYDLEVLGYDDFMAQLFNS